MTKQFTSMARAIACGAVLLAGVGTASADAYIDGPISQIQTSCPVTGTVVYATGLWGGFYDAPTPRTDGSVTYVHALVWNQSGCTNDAPTLDIALPSGASLAIDAAHPVRCWRGHSQLRGHYEAIPDSSISECRENPTVSAYGYHLGFSALPPGWWMEMQVPVKFTQGGTQTFTASSLSHLTRLNATFDVPVATGTAPPPPQASFSQFMAGSNAAGDTVNFALRLQTNHLVGEFSVEWGTTLNFGLETSAALTDARAAYYDNVKGQLFNTPPGTIIYWRAKFVVNGIAYYGATQSLKTSIVYTTPRPPKVYPPPRCTGFCPV